MKKHHKPIIGITTDYEEENKSYSQYPWFALRENYIKSCEKYGANCIILPISKDSIDLNLKEKYSPPLNQLFTQLSPQIENSFIKIGLILTRKSLIYNFTKIIDYSSNTEYFLNNKKVSLKKFAIESSRFKFDKFKKITSIFGRYTNCFDSNLIYELIEKFSNKTKTFSEIIKISFLEEKLQENYLFYSKQFFLMICFY